MDRRCHRPHPEIDVKIRCLTTLVAFEEIGMAIGNRNLVKVVSEIKSGIPTEERLRIPDRRSPV